MNKYITKIMIGVTALACMCGCTQMKGWFNSADFTTVVSVVSPALKTAAQATIMAVCKKNPDLNKIFIASANGLKIAINSSDYSTDQIEEYIKQGLGKEVDTWYPLVKSSMDTLLSWYGAIYDKYFDIKDEACIKGFNTLLTAMADGIIEGASVKADVVASTSYVNAKSKEVLAVGDLRAKCSQFGIVIE